MTPDHEAAAAEELKQVKAHIADAHLENLAAITAGQDRICANQEQLLKLTPTIQALVVAVLFTFVIFAASSVAQWVNANQTRELIEKVCAHVDAEVDNTDELECE